MAIEVSRHDDRQEYVALVDGKPAGLIGYSEAAGTVVMSHTEVDDAFEGQGVGSQLVRHALDDVRERGLHVAPDCPFVAHFISTHSDYEDLLAQS